MTELPTTEPPPYEVTVLAPPDAKRTVLFAAGAGGSPTRHGPLLEALAASGCKVVAPHFERLASPRPTETELTERARRLRSAIGQHGVEGPLVGIGHSIGASLLLAMAGATLWLGPGSSLPLPRLPLDRLVLMTPPTGFFAAPNALAGVTTTAIQAWSGERDAITPRAQTERILQALGPRLDLRVLPRASHFTFMHEPPPHIPDLVEGREALLAELTREVCTFSTGEPQSQG